MPLLPIQIQSVIDEFSKLPGIGAKSAERLTFHLLRSTKANPITLGNALLHLKESIHYCEVCQMITSEKRCEICCRTDREQSTVLVTEEPLEVVAFEKSGYRGVYHVLHGVLSPIDGMGPEQLKIKELIDRAQKGDIKEIIIATNLDVEGEATATFIRQKLSNLPIVITRLAHGLPSGADIEFADHITLKEALAGRRQIT